MEVERPNPHYILIDCSYFISTFCCADFLVCFHVLLPFSPLYEFSERDPSFLGINYKCCKAFCTLARYHYLKICWQLI